MPLPVAADMVVASAYFEKASRASGTKAVSLSMTFAQKMKEVGCCIMVSVEDLGVLSMVLNAGATHSLQER